MQYKIPIQLQPEAADYNDCFKKTKLEKKQDRISKKCDIPLSEVFLLYLYQSAWWTKKEIWIYVTTLIVYVYACKKTSTNVFRFYLL